MQYKLTLEGYPVLLKTRTRAAILTQETLLHGNRTTTWLYLTQNPAGRWQVLMPDPEYPGDILCIAGAPTARQVLPVMTAKAYELGIFKRGDRHTKSALGYLGSWVAYHGGPNTKPVHGYLRPSVERKD